MEMVLVVAMLLAGAAGDGLWSAPKVLLPSASRPVVDS